MFLKIKKIPKVNWTSDKPHNLKPKFSTFFFLCFGLTLFGLGEGFQGRLNKIEPTLYFQR